MILCIFNFCTLFVRHFYDSLLILFCILDGRSQYGLFRLDEEDYCGTSDSSCTFFWPFFTVAGFLWKFVIFLPSWLLSIMRMVRIVCFQQSVFSGVFFVDGIYIVCCRIHCVENAEGQESYIRGFSSIYT